MQAACHAPKQVEAAYTEKKSQKHEIYNLFGRLARHYNSFLRNKSKEPENIVPAVKEVFHCLLFDHHNTNSGKCYPSQNTIAEETGYTRTTVNKAVQVLQRLGLLHIKHRKWKGGLYKNGKRRYSKKWQSSNQYDLAKNLLVTLREALKYQVNSLFKAKRIAKVKKIFVGSNARVFQKGNIYELIANKFFVKSGLSGHALEPPPDARLTRLQGRYYLLLKFTEV